MGDVNAIPTFLNHSLGIPERLVGAWKPTKYEDEALWTFLPTETLISETGWSKHIVQCNLLRGCIKSNPGPRTRKGPPSPLVVTDAETRSPGSHKPKKARTSLSTWQQQPGTVAS